MNRHTSGTRRLPPCFASKGTARARSGGKTVCRASTARARLIASTRVCVSVFTRRRTERTNERTNGRTGGVRTISFIHGLSDPSDEQTDGYTRGNPSIALVRRDAARTLTEALTGVFFIHSLSFSRVCVRVRATTELPTGETKLSLWVRRGGDERTKDTDGPAPIHPSIHPSCACEIDK
jgi:hypothetical protein